MTQSWKRWTVVCALSAYQCSTAMQTGQDARPESSSEASSVEDTAIEDTEPQDALVSEDANTEDVLVVDNVVPQDVVAVDVGPEGSMQDVAMDTLRNDVSSSDVLSDALRDVLGDVVSDAPRADVVADGGTGTRLGNFYNTYYYLALQSDYTGANDTTLYDGTCRPIAMVPAAYSDSVCIEGSGRLSDGRVINASTSCACARPCPTGGRVCYAVLDPVRFPWGQGSRANALVPLRSWATDRTVLVYGTVLYVPRWDGVAIPALDGIGGFMHDGCFRADDVGGGITGNQVDIFAGSRTMWRALERLVPTRTTFEVRTGATRCSYLMR